MRRISIVISLALFAGCGASQNEAAEASPKKASPPSQKRVASGEPELVIGQMCPNLAAGRPAVIPLALRAGVWKADGGALSRMVAGHGTRQFSVFGWSGQRAGTLAVAGLATSGGRQLAVGAYTGALPCHDKEGNVVAACMATTGGCGLALSRVEPAGGLRARPFEEDPEPLELEMRTTCLSNDELAVDIDGDGRHELFALDGLLERGELAAEWVASKSAAKQCEPATGHGLLARGVVLLAAADIDRDGRTDLLVSRRSQGEESWALYRSIQTAVRLEKVVEVPVRYSAHSQSAAEP